MRGRQRFKPLSNLFKSAALEDLSGYEARVATEPFAHSLYSIHVGLAKQASLQLSDPARVKADFPLLPLPRLLAVHYLAACQLSFSSASKKLQ